MNFSKISAALLALVATFSYGEDEKKAGLDKIIALECEVDIKIRSRTLQERRPVLILIREGKIYKTIGSSVGSPLMYVDGKNFPFFLSFNFEHEEGMAASIGWSHEVVAPEKDYVLKFNLNRLSGHFEYYWSDKFTTNEAIGRCRGASTKF